MEFISLSLIIYKTAHLCPIPMIKIRIGYSYKEGRVAKKLSACTNTPTKGLLMLKTQALDFILFNNVLTE